MFYLQGALMQTANYICCRDKWLLCCAKWSACIQVVWTSKWMKFAWTDPFMLYLRFGCQFCHDSSTREATFVSPLCSPNSAWWCSLQPIIFILGWLGLNKVMTSAYRALIQQEFFLNPSQKKDCFAIYFDLFNATTFVIFNQLVGAGHPITHTCKCFSRCRPFTRS
jgi:hypothetical protein